MPWWSALSARRARASACCCSIVGGSASRAWSARRWYRASRAAASACMSRAPTSGASRPRILTAPSSSGYTCKRTAGVLPGGLPGLGLPVHPPPAADDPLDVLCRARAPHRQQSLFGFGRGHARQGPDLGVRQLCPGEGLGQQGQRAEGARHPHVLAGRPGGEPHAPGQPGGAATEAVVPAAARVELADEIEQASGGGAEVGRQLSNLVAEPIELRGGLQVGGTVGRTGVHRRFSLCSAPTLHAGFRAPLAPPGRAIARRSTFSVR